MSEPKIDYDSAVAAIRAKISIQPEIGLVLGSGLGGLADAVQDAVSIDYSDIPGWPRSTVQGHGGRLVIGTLAGKAVLVQQGRAHFYEGYHMNQVTFPIRVMARLGIKTLILTNAAGGLNDNFNPGDVMLINDHINFMGMTGQNPLVGPNDESFGPRFPGMVHTYDRELRRLAHRIAKENAIKLYEGVYVCLSGPAYETPAEVRMLRHLGADAVGMSTAPEVVVARHAGLRVMAISGITNKAIDNMDEAANTNHEEVLESGTIIVPKLVKILTGVLGAL